MVKRYSKRNKRKIVEFSVGDNVSVKVPRIDRTRTDAPRLPCVVINISGNDTKNYKLLSRHGAIERRYRAGDLQKFAGTFNINIDEAEKNYISLRSASQLENSQNSLHRNPKCMCKTGCAIH